MQPSGTRICPKCSGEVRGGWRVCPVCLTPLAAEAETQTVHLREFPPSSSPPLSERLRPLPRTMDWFVTGPLVFSERLWQPADQAVYRAGDSLGFIDPAYGRD